MPNLGTFGLGIEKNIVKFEISTLKFAISESSTDAGNFSIGSALSKGPGSVFSESLGCGPCPVYKYALYFTFVRLPSLELILHSHNRIFRLFKSMKVSHNFSHKLN